MQQDSGVIETLRWLIEAGADEVIGEVPVDRFVADRPATSTVQPRPPTAPLPRAPLPPRTQVEEASPQPAALVAPARVVHAQNLAELRAQVEAFEGCALKATATRTVFGVGNAGAKLMLIGEAPGAEEDRQGVPFVGASGQLLDRMLGSIGLDREQVYITNTLYWRPPGNRTPAPAEVGACLPFLLRQIELVGPRILVLVGAAAARTLLGRSEGIMRLRGQWFSYAAAGLENPIPTRATFHPAFLLRSPGQKREAWRDLLEVREKLDSIDVKLASAARSK